MPSTTGLDDIVRPVSSITSLSRFSIIVEPAFMRPPDISHFPGPFFSWEARRISRYFPSGFLNKTLTPTCSSIMLFYYYNSSLRNHTKPLHWKYEYTNQNLKKRILHPRIWNRNIGHGQGRNR